MSEKESVMIDFAKSLAICLMVIGHSGTYDWLRSCIYVFHMPLFYVISGYCFKEEYCSKPILYLKKRAKSLYFPFVIGGGIFVILHNVFQDIHLLVFVPDSYLWRRYDMMDVISRIIDIFRFLHVEELIGGFWFLPSLFWSSILFISLLLVLKRITQRTWLLVPILLGITWLASFVQFDFPLFHFNMREFFGATFMATGYITRKSIDVLRRNTFIVIFLPVVLLGQMINSEISHLHHDVVIPYYLCAILCSFGVFSIGLRLTRVCRLAYPLVACIHYIGRSTKDILMWHFMSFKIVTLCYIYVCGMCIDNLVSFPVLPDCGMWIMYSFVGILLPLLLKKYILVVRNLLNDRLWS